MTDIVPVPPMPDVPLYPALGSSNFNTEAYAYGSSMRGVSQRQYEIAQAAYTNAVAASEKSEDARLSAASALNSAAAAEVSARNAAVVAGATRWAVGMYKQGDAVWSPLSLLTYRRATEGVTQSLTDPSLDPDGWRLTGSPVGMPQVALYGAGPHRLTIGTHYLLMTADIVALMPSSPAPQETVRITNLSLSGGPVLDRNGATFKGNSDNLSLDEDNADHNFTFTLNNGWV